MFSSYSDTSGCAKSKGTTWTRWQTVDVIAHFASTPRILDIFVTPSYLIWQDERGCDAHCMSPSKCFDKSSLSPITFILSLMHTEVDSLQIWWQLLIRAFCLQHHSVGDILIHVLAITPIVGRTLTFLANHDYSQYGYCHVLAKMHRRNADNWAWHKMHFKYAPQTFNCDNIPCTISWTWSDEKYFLFYFAKTGSNISLFCQVMA